VACSHIAGIPTSQSLEPITKSAREKKGKKGGVTRIAYMTALAPAIGENLATSIASGPSGGAPPTNMDEISSLHARHLSLPFHLPLTTYYHSRYVN
jgi:hypothetical protein